MRSPTAYETDVSVTNLKESEDRDSKSQSSVCAADCHLGCTVGGGTRTQLHKTRKFKTDVQMFTISTVLYISIAFVLPPEDDLQRL